MFVWGDDDPLVPLAFCVHVADALPDARQVVLNECGHVPQVELPEDTNGLIRRLHGEGARHAPRPRGRPHREGAKAPRLPRGMEAKGGTRSLIRRAAAPLAGALRGRLTADLDDRDPDYIRENLPFAWLLSTLWFRGEVRGIGPHSRAAAPSCSSATTPAAT